MSETSEQQDIRLVQLLISLQAGAMQQMGKVASPLSGKIERDLTLAKVTIDMIEMLAEKTKGNLTDYEQKLIDHMLYELRMNYVDEAKKGEQESTEEAAEQKDSRQQQKEPDSGKAAWTRRLLRPMIDGSDLKIY